MAVGSSHSGIRKVISGISAPTTLGRRSRASPYLLMRTIQVKVKPNSSSAGLEAMSDGTWVARVKARPVDGKANKELIALIAQHFKLRKAQVSIKSGGAARMKLIQLEG